MTGNPDRLAAALADRYRIERELGAGGMATVYLAADLKHDRKVAIKVLKPELAAVLGAERFVQEIKTTAALSHPHILPLLDSGEAAGLLYYVMPFIEGETIRDRLNRETQLGIDEAVRIATEVADALDYAHRHGVIHRDIKPENILLHDGRAMVMDFGIALAVSAAAGGRMTETGLSLGTPHYMSPEQATADKQITARSDVYSLASVLYEMLTGEPPHMGTSAQQIIMKIIAEPAKPATALRKSVPPNVSAALARALEKLPADRFESARIFADALANPGFLVAGKAGASDTVGWRDRFREPQVIGAALLLLAAGIAAGLWISPRLAGGREAEGARFFTLTLPDSAPLVAGRNRYDMDLRSLDISRDGRQVVYVTGREGRTSLVLLKLDAGTTAPLKGSDGATLPAFSSDGRSIAFVVDNEVRRISLADGLVTRVADGVRYGMDLLWPSDDRIYLVDNFCLRAVRATGGELSAIANGCNLTSLRPISGRSDWFLGSSTGRIRLVSASGEAPHRLGTASMRDSVLVGTSPRFVAPSFLTFLRDSTLYAASFDPGALRLTSEPVPVFTGIRREAITGSAHLEVAGDGTMVWGPGGDGSSARFVWVGPGGTVQDTLFLPPSSVLAFALSRDGRRLTVARALPGGRRSLVIADLQRQVVDSMAGGEFLEPLNWIRSGRALTVRAPRWVGTLEVDGANFRIDSTGPAFADEAQITGLRCHAGRRVVVWPVAGVADSTVLFTGDGNNWCRFSPDGRWVSWNGVSPGGVFIAPADSLGGRDRLQVGPDGGDEPRWSRDGRELIYRLANQWYAVRVPERRGANIAPPRLLFQGHYLQANVSWDLGPDGRALVLQGLPPARINTLRVVTDLPSLLEARRAVERN